LRENYQVKNEIWLIYPRKQSADPRIPYNDAVEEALCFGWIDSIVKSVDANRYAQRFTPRHSGSSFSQTNKERLRRMIEKGKVMTDVLRTLGDQLEDPFRFPEDIREALRANQQAWDNFQTYSGSYQRIRISYVDVARDRPEEFEKRLRNLVLKTEQNKQFGFGIESYY